VVIFRQSSRRSTRASLRLDLAFLLLTLAANFAASWIAAYPNGATFTMQSRQAERDAAAPKYQKREFVLRGEEERGVGGGLVKREG
jgi:hypothetical protein